MAPSNSLEKSVLFLQKRDGVDKVLKLMRYAAKLACVSALRDSDSDLARKLHAVEGSLGTTRKALKLGKFLADADKLAKLKRDKVLWPLELVANGGEMVYLFLEQITWLIKVGVLAKRLAPGVTRYSAWSELVGYVGSLLLSAVALTNSYRTERFLCIRQWHLQQQGSGTEKEDKQISEQLASLQFKRKLRILSIVQDFADAAIATNDIQGGRGRFSSPVFLSVLGLLSASISTHKNWPR